MAICKVDGEVVKKNLKVYSEAKIRLRGNVPFLNHILIFNCFEGQDVPMNVKTKLWGIRKPAHVLCTLDKTMVAPG